MPVAESGPFVSATDHLLGSGVRVPPQCPEVQNPDCRMVVKEEGSLGFPSLPTVNFIASPGCQLWGQHTALSAAPVRVAMGSLLGDQVNGMKALRPPCTFMDPADRHKTVGVGCRGLST